MIQRYYFSSTEAPDETAPAPIADHVTYLAKKLTSTKGSSALTDVSVTYDVADHIFDLESSCLQFVGNKLKAQSLPNQTVKLQMRCKEANANNNLFLSLKIYLLRAGLLLATTRGGTEMSTTLTNRSVSVTTTLGPISVEDGDRLVVEIGWGGLPAAITGICGHNATLNYGEDDAIDLPENETHTTSATPWIDFDPGFLMADWSDAKFYGTIQA